MFNRIWKNLVLIALVLSLSIFNVSILEVAARTHDATKNAKKEKAPAFTLKDQFEHETSFQFPREKPTILTFADKEGAEQLEAWVRPLTEKYAEKIDIQGIAELSGVPGIAKGVVRNIIKKKTKYPVMLDWKGDVSKSYSFQKNNVNIFLIDKEGNIITKQIGAIDNAKLENFCQEIEALLK